MSTSAVFIDLQNNISKETELHSTREELSDKSSLPNDRTSHCESYCTFTKKVNMVKPLPRPNIMDFSSPPPNSEVRKEKKKKAGKKHGAINGHLNNSLNKCNQGSDVSHSKTSTVSLTTNSSISEGTRYYEGVSRIFKCEICNQFFQDVLQLSDHSCYRSMCLLCTISFSSKSERAEHFEKVHNNPRRRTVCTVCGSPLPQASAACAKCSKKTSVKEFAKKKTQNKTKVHNLPKHPTVSTQELGSKPSGRVSRSNSKSQSEVLLSKFITAAKLIEPKDECGVAVVKDNQFKCVKCDHIFKRCSQVCLHYKHCKSVPDKTKSISKDNVLWLCLPCQLSFDRRAELCKHKKGCSVRRSKKRPFTSSSKESASELETGESKANYWCTKCGIGCISPYSVIDHECEIRMTYMESCHVHMERLATELIPVNQLYLLQPPKKNYQKRHDIDRRIRQNVGEKCVKQEVTNSPGREDQDHFQYDFQIKTENIGEVDTSRVLLYECKLCQETFTLLAEFDFHMLRKHGFNVSVNDDSRNECVKCKVHFATPVELHLHRCSAKNNILEEGNRPQTVVAVTSRVSPNYTVQSSSIGQSQHMTIDTQVKPMSVNAVAAHHPMQLYPSASSSAESQLNLETEKFAAFTTSQSVDPQVAHSLSENPMQLPPMPIGQNLQLYQNYTSPNAVLNNLAFFGSSFFKCFLCRKCQEPYDQNSSSASSQHAACELPYENISKQPMVTLPNQSPVSQKNLHTLESDVSSNLTDSEVPKVILPLEKMEFVKENMFDRPDAYAVKSVIEKVDALASVERYICSNCYMSFIDKDDFATHISHVHQYSMERTVKIQFVKNSLSKRTHADS